LPTGVLDALATNESHFDAAAISPKNAQGLMQLMPAVSGALGVTDPFNWIQSSLGGATLFQQLQTRYKGDLRKELAAWNWNPKSLDEDVRKNGSDWEKHAPQETQNFISRVLRTMQLNRNSPTVNLTIVNKAGADIAASVNSGGI
jgi:soluble lytic murein transglycosylase-like protein